MGGDYEKEVQTQKKAEQVVQGAPPGQVEVQSAPAAAAPTVATLERPTAPPPSGGQRIRFHLSNGEVHFHADADKLKVAVPVAEWYTMSRGLKHLQPQSYLDATRKTILNIGITLQNGVADSTIEITKADVGDTLQKLHDFAKQL